MCDKMLSCGQILIILQSGILNVSMRTVSGTVVVSLSNANLCPILPSVNYEINNYKAFAKKTKLLRKSFTTSNEQDFDLKYYSRRWIEQLEAKEGGGERRTRLGHQYVAESAGVPLPNN